MKAMKKIESFLRDFSWKIKLAIFLAFIFWAPQTFYPLINTIKENYHPGVIEAVKPTIEEELKWSQELREFAKPIIEKARAKRLNYGPWDYFRDYKTLKDFEAKFPGPNRFYSAFNATHDLVFIRDESFRAKKVSAEEVRAARIYNGFERKVPDPPTSAKSLLREMADYGVFSWIINLYFRGLLLALILYLVRMSQDDGILAIFLSGKKKFAKAVFFWPANLIEYPKYELRKIIVEAELRRLGSIWHKLNPAEQKLVKEIASRSKAEYKRWIADYELKNAQRFKRSFEWALVGTVLILLSQTVAPVSVKAEIRDSVCVEQGKVYNEYDTHMNSPGDDHGSFSPDNAPMWVEEIFIPSAPCSVQRMKVFFEKLKIQEFARSVFKIPVRGYLVKGFLLQTR